MPNRRKIPTVLTGKRRIIFAKICAIAVAQAGLAAASAFLIRDIFDALNANGQAWPTETLAALAVLALVAVAMAWCRFAERTGAEVLGQRYVHILRLKLFDHLSGQPLHRLQGGTRGGHLLRFIGDLNAIRQWISLGLARLSVSLLMAVDSLAALGFINFRLALTVAIAIFVGGYISFLLGNRLHDAARTSRRNRARLASDITERISMMPVIQAFSQVTRERRRLARRGRRLRKSMIKRARVVGSLRGVSELVTGLAVVAILAVGGIEINAGRASAGSLLAAMSILGMLTPALRNLSRCLEYWHTYRISVERIETFLATPLVDNTEQKAYCDLKPGPGKIEFDNVHADNRLRGITAMARAGSIITIVGPNGGGKSTLLSLVSRFLQPTSGRILIDGQDISTCTIQSLRSAIGMVSADLALMRGTIKRNICYRCPSATQAELERVCDLCGITDMLTDFPLGLEARVFEGGTNLSLGQRQRIALARALIGEPRILLLDEADANLDPGSMELIDRVLKSFAGTVIVASHRMERIMHAARIWHVADGQIIETSTASNLLQHKGPTFELLADVIMPLQHSIRQHNGQSGNELSQAKTTTTTPVDCVERITRHPIERRRLDRVKVLTSQLEPRCPYLLYTPETVNKNLPVLVTVHGISCNAEEHIDAFAEYADRFGFIVVAPVFAKAAYAGYQRFGYSKRNSSQRSDLALCAIMDDVAEQTGFDTAKFLLFGYSGGGQFAHRFAMAYPDRVISTALGAPGWFSYPSTAAPFPRGLRGVKAALELDFEPERFLTVPMMVCVGEHDTQRDPALNTSARIDSQQGKTRFERGERWVQVMRKHARNCGYDTRYEFHSLLQSTHDFAQCTQNGGMIERVLKFFQLDIDVSLTQEKEVDTRATHQFTPMEHIVTTTAKVLKFERSNKS